jgi:hypothetical protein
MAVVVVLVPVAVVVVVAVTEVVEPMEPLVLADVGVMAARAATHHLLDGFAEVAVAVAPALRGQVCMVVVMEPLVILAKVEVMLTIMVGAGAEQLEQQAEVPVLVDLVMQALYILAVSQPHIHFMPQTA